MRSTSSKKPLLWLLPFGICFLFFYGIPLLNGIYASFQSNSLFGKPTWIGLSNYEQVWKDLRFFLSIKNTIFYSLCLTILTVICCFFLAILISVSFPFAKIISRLALLIPSICPSIILSILFILFFSGKYGILNQWILEPLNLPSPDWIKNPYLIKIALVFQGLWRWTGLMTLFILAKLESIPRKAYEMAKLENSSAVSRFWNITLPQCKKTLFFITIFLIIDSFILFEGAYSLLGSSGGVEDSGLLFVSYVYLISFTYGKFGLATAMNFSVLPVFFIFFYAILFYNRKNENSH